MVRLKIVQLAVIPSYYRFRPVSFASLPFSKFAQYLNFYYFIILSSKMKDKIIKKCVLIK